MAEVKTYPTGALPEVSLPTAPPRKGQKVPVPRGRYKARGVVLHTLKYGERQLIIHIFTAEYGRRSYITKLSQRNNPRGLFQPLFVLENVTYSVKDRDIGLLQCWTIHNGRGIDRISQSLGRDIIQFLVDTRNTLELRIVATNEIQCSLEFDRFVRNRKDISSIARTLDVIGIIP